MSNRREFLQHCLALVPASIIGRGFLKSANVQNAVYKSDTPIVFADNIRPSDLSRFPDGWHLYESCGQTLFPCYGVSGGLCTKTMAYLVRKKPDIRNYSDLPFDDRVRLGWVSGTYTEYIWECIPLEFSDLGFIAVDYDEQAMVRLINHKIDYAIKHRKPQPINLNGGNFPHISSEERAEEDKFYSELADHLTGVIPRIYGA